MSKKEKIIYFIISVILVVFGSLCGVGIYSQFNVSDEDFTLTLESQTQPALIEHEDGTTEEILIPTVEEIDGGKLNECEGECGQGVYVDVSTPQKFYDSVIGTCQNTDGYHGAQCYDLMDLAYQNMVGRNLSTCGTGAANGVLSCDKNLDGFRLSYDVADIHAGGIVVLNGGKYGHIGMAMGDAHNGYVALLGQNQGGKSCEGGGSSANLVNVNLKNFIGVLIWEGYDKKDEPELDPSSSNLCFRYEVQEGDTLSSIMKHCEGEVNWEEMDSYADSWQSMKVKLGQTVYEGWHSDTGVGLYAGDIIERK